MSEQVIWFRLVQKNGDKWVSVWDEWGNLVAGTNREGIEAFALSKPYPDQYRLIEGVKTID